MTPPEPLPPLLPTQHRSPAERLLHGKGVATAVGRGRAEDWTRLDQGVSVHTWRPGPRWSTGRFRVGFHWFDSRELADWTTAPHWHETGPAGGPGGVAGWSQPPTGSEIALALCHADPRLRAAALRLAEDGALPAATLPLVLIRCADTDATVRELARAVLDGALSGSGAAADDAARALVPLALLLDLRRHGSWAREAVLDRTGRKGEVVAEAVAELLASRAFACRRAGVRAAASAGLLDAAGAYAAAERETDVSVAVEAARTAVRLSRQAVEADETAREDVLGRFHALMGLRRDPVLARTVLATALDEDLLGPADLVRLAVSHHGRITRRTALAALLAVHDPSPFLDTLATARDAAVRSAAVERLRTAGRGGELARHLTDSHAPVRALALRELRAAGGDPYAAYRALCLDPAAVTPAAVTGLAGRRDPEDVPLFHALTLHVLGPVRARALAALRMLGALPGDGPVAFADDPDRTVRKTVLRAVRHQPEALRALLTAAHEDVRATALDLLSTRHGLAQREIAPFLEDPAPSVTRVARGAVRWNRSELPLPFLLDLAAPDRPRAQRAAGLALMHDDGARLLAALRLADDPDATLRWTARGETVRLLRRLEEEVGAPYGDEVRRLVERHASGIPGWQDEIRRRNRATRGR
ncbi:hypothetical protein AB0424_10000 [Streptomyces sp. NPDC051180]|uniref:hypothetical protein n=1 Tax=Streptomyces sp. NPDC051180 TaxID=3155797 RepID=UPI003450F841